MTAIPENEEKRGLPLWMPLLGLAVALVITMYIALRILPTLTGLILPPDPPVPPVATTAVTHESKGVGLDEWLYATDATGCEVARYYQNRVGGCSYDPDSGCQTPSRNLPGSILSAQHIVTCQGGQSQGAYSVSWTIYVSSGYSEGGQTRFRVIREVAG